MSSSLKGGGPFGCVPEEVLERILADLVEPVIAHTQEESDREDYQFICPARLVCQQWNRLIIPHLFRTIRLQHTMDSTLTRFATWNSMIDSEAVRHAARRVIIHSIPGKSWDPYEKWWLRWRTGDYPGFIQAIHRIEELPAVHALEIHFSRTYSTDEYADVERRETRFHTIRTVFEAIDQRRQRGLESGGFSEIESLTLFNLQNDEQAAFVASDLFKSVVSTVKKLQLLDAEAHDRDESWDAVAYERPHFEPHLQTELLPRAADHLTALTLCFREPWGITPINVDGHALLFPQLRTLHLGNFVIRHHDSMDWVLAQKSLTCLRLDRCYIAHHFVVPNLGWRIKTHDWEPGPPVPNGRSHIYNFPGTWEETFDRIRTGLPELRDFRFDHSDSRRGFHFFRSSTMRADLVRNRYMMFDIYEWVVLHDPGDRVVMDFGDDPEPWADPTASTRSRDTREGDLRGLRDLMQTIEARGGKRIKT